MLNTSMWYVRSRYRSPAPICIGSPPRNLLSGTSSLLLVRSLTAKVGRGPHIHRAQNRLYGGPSRVVCTLMASKSQSSQPRGLMFARGVFLPESRTNSTW